MWTPVAPTRLQGESVALGWFVRDVDGKRKVAHDGALPGAVSYLALIPADRRAVFGSLNRTYDLDHLSTSESYLRRTASSAVAGKPPATVPALAGAAATRVLAGEYSLPESRRFSLDVDAAGQLWLETDGQWSALQLPKLVKDDSPRAADAQAAVSAWATEGQSGMAVHFTPDMRANVPPGALDGVWGQFVEQHGAYRRHHVYAASNDFAEVRIEFERASIDIGIVYDAQGLIDGLQPMGQETQMPATRVRAWATADGGLWIDGSPYGGPDVAASINRDRALTFMSGQRAVRLPPH